MRKMFVFQCVTMTFLDLPGRGDILCVSLRVHDTLKKEKRD